MSRPSQPLISLFYVSRAVRPMHGDELAELLRRSRERNAGKSVTGVLLYKDQSFAQVIEGPASVIDELFETIAADPRHTNVNALIREQIRDRRFDRRAMGYATVDAVPDEARRWFVPYLDDPDSLNELIARDHDNAHLMLRTFIESLDASAAPA